LPWCNCCCCCWVVGAWPTFCLYFTGIYAPYSGRYNSCQQEPQKLLMKFLPRSPTYCHYTVWTRTRHPVAAGSGSAEVMGSRPAPVRPRQCRSSVNTYRTTVIQVNKAIVFHIRRPVRMRLVIVYARVISYSRLYDTFSISRHSRMPSWKKGKCGAQT
jgi:hypothetical protein